ncbi:MAG TPA: cupin domain-containing protein [Acidimicrobiales bacterium]|nr:cupin domain-containing protein [Acidimicrobiales bacterium]
MPDDVALEQLYDDFAAQGLMPLWTQRAGLMPLAPTPAAVPHVWPWDTTFPLAERSGQLVPVGRGGERRAIAYANPGLGGQPYATPTLWAAVQYLGPREVAPAHRHTQGAFRFVLEGEGVWTVVDGDPVAMRRGDLLLTAAWAWHEHHNTGNAPMAWLDGLDIPLVAALDAGFFEFGPDEVTDRSTPERSRSERLWAHPGLRPLGAPPGRTSPLGAYRWAHTDAALADQLELEAEGQPGVVGPGHAAIRFSDPATGADALPTLRMEMHRLARGAATATRRTVGSTVAQVFAGEGEVELDGRTVALRRGDVVAVPSWCPVRWRAATAFDLFMFGDAPVYEALGLDRTTTEGDRP